MQKHPTARPRELTSTLISVIVLVVLLLAGVASASGSGYNQSYTRTAGSVSDSAVDLISVSSSDPGGNNITISFQVSGTVVLNSAQAGYYAWFGGSAAINSTAWVWLVNNMTSAQLYSMNSASHIPFTLGNAGASVTFSVAKAVVGSSASFSVNVYAFAVTSGSIAYSWLGTNYQGGGGASCGAVGCTTTGAGFALGSLLLYLVIGGVVIVAVVVLVVVLVVMRGKRTTPPGMWAPGGPAIGPPPPPPPPPLAPPPPP